MSNEAADASGVTRRSILKQTGTAALAGSALAGATGSAAAATTIPVNIFVQPSVDESYVEMAEGAINAFSTYVEFDLSPDPKGAYSRDYDCDLHRFSNDIYKRDGEIHLLINDCGQDKFSKWVKSDSPGVCHVHSHANSNVYQNMVIHETAHCVGADHQHGDVIRTGRRWNPTDAKSPMITTKGDHVATCSGTLAEKADDDAYTIEPADCTIDRTEAFVAKHF